MTLVVGIDANRTIFNNDVKYFSLDFYEKLARSVLAKRAPECINDDDFIADLIYLMVKAHGRFKGEPTEKNIAKWILCSAHYAILTLRRRKVRNLPIIADAPDSRKKCIDELIFSEDLNNVQQALDSLPEHQRKCIEMHYYDRLPYRKIAEQVGVSHQMVSNYIHQGIAKIKENVT